MTEEHINISPPGGLRVIEGNQSLNNATITYNFCCSNCLSSLHQQLQSGNNLTLAVSGVCLGSNGVYYLSCRHGHPLFVRIQDYPVFQVAEATYQYDGGYYILRTTTPILANLESDTPVPMITD